MGAIAYDRKMIEVTPQIVYLAAFLFVLDSFVPRTKIPRELFIFPVPRNLVLANLNAFTVI